jgi:hypothetical protein
MNKAWASVEAGKEFHWAHVLDASGTQLLPRRVENGEADLSKLIDDALLLAEEVVWAVDQPGGGAALLLALLWERDQKVLSSSVSAWIGLATPTVESPKPMPVMLALSPTKRG